MSSAQGRPISSTIRNTLRLLVQVEILSIHEGSDYRWIKLGQAGEIWMFGPIQSGSQHREALQGMLKKVFDFQINRLFVPHGFKPGSDESLLPAYARKMLDTRLKAVYYYNTPIPNVEICGSQQVADLIQRSIAEFSQQWRK